MKKRRLRECSADALQCAQLSDSWTDARRKLDSDAQAAFKLLIANKCDMIHERIVSPAMGRMLADELRMEYMETSAKTAMNVREAFNAMAIGLKRRCGPPSRRRRAVAAGLLRLPVPHRCHTGAVAVSLLLRLGSSAREPLPASGSAPLRVLVSGDSVGGYFGSCSC